MTESNEFLIYSNHHKCWWGPNGSGYRSHIADAGRYNLADTGRWLGRGCGCCVVPEIVVPAPPAEVLADPDALSAYAVNKRRVATLKAKREGRVNKYAEVATR
jgi:hypothetical protein